MSRADILSEGPIETILFTPPTSVDVFRG